MKKIIHILVTALIFCSLFGCSAENKEMNVTLTEEQEAQIDLMIQHREDWKEVKELFASYPVNRVHIAESDNGVVILTVAHVEDDTALGQGWETYIVHGFAVSGSTFTSIDSYHKDWIADCVSVDMEDMSDSELREVLVESYKKSLAKE